MSRIPNHDEERGRDVEKSKTSFDDFLKEDRFELQSYLTYLFTRISDYFPEQTEENMINQ
ncbi:hypothetical protein BGM25_23485 [Bacillus sp. FJAT-29953]|nr:hypothetical protein [Bacillus sp. FJAT-29953]